MLTRLSIRNIVLIEALDLQFARGLWLAADLRFRNVTEKFDTTSHTPEALYRLTESSLALGVPQEAVKYAAVLGANYPGSKWYERAFELVGKHAEGVTAS